VVADLDLELGRKCANRCHGAHCAKDSVTSTDLVLTSEDRLRYVLCAKRSPEGGKENHREHCIRRLGAVWAEDTIKLFRLNGQHRSSGVHWPKSVESHGTYARFAYPRISVLSIAHDRAQHTNCMLHMSQGNIRTPGPLPVLYNLELMYKMLLCGQGNCPRSTILAAAC